MPRGQIELNLLGLTLLSVTLVAVTGLVTASLLAPRQPPLDAANATSAAVLQNAKPPGAVPSWGELICSDISLEQPDEYLGFELNDTNRAPQWTFTGMNREQTERMLATSGMAPKLAAQAVSKTQSTNVNGTTIVYPPSDLLLALSPETRSRLYGQLAKLPGNPYLTYPFCFPRNTFAQWFGDGSHDTRQMAIVRKLSYPRGGSVCFSDIECLLRQEMTDHERMDILSQISRQTAVLVRLRIRPDTDIDKLLGYWGHGVAIENVRPLVESIARLEDGSTISLLYFLPKFARDHLYKFPMPAEAGDPIMDCHWSTMNFFNDTPDNRFTGTSVTMPFLKTNYVQVATADSYGDVIVLLNEDGKAIHSVLHIADDIVFTKNGYNSAQPWMLMRLGDLLARYTIDAPPKVLVYRKKNR